MLFRSSDIRKAAVASLGLLKQATPEVIEALIARLWDGYPAVCQAAAEALGLLGVPSSEVIEALIKGLMNTSLSFQNGAVVSLGKLLSFQNLITPFEEAVNKLPENSTTINTAPDLIQNYQQHGFFGISSHELNDNPNLFNDDIIISLSETTTTQNASPN